MNSKHRKTLKEIFSDPVNGNIEWRKIEALFLAFDVVRTERAGRFRSQFCFNDVRADFQRPHPDKEALRKEHKPVGFRDTGKSCSHLIFMPRSGFNNRVQWLRVTTHGFMG